MLVPVIRTCRPRPGGVPAGVDRADKTATPGASKSGFSRPSRVGPELEKDAMSRKSDLASYAPATIVLRPLQMEFVVKKGFASPVVKADWAPRSSSPR